LTYKARDGGLRRAWDWSVRCGADEMLRTTTTPPCEHIEVLVEGWDEMEDSRRLGPTMN